jgi:hypothetical protein
MSYRKIKQIYVQYTFMEQGVADSHGTNIYKYLFKSTQVVQF